MCKYPQDSTGGNNKYHQPQQTIYVYGLLVEDCSTIYSICDERFIGYTWAACTYMYAEQAV